MARITGRMGTLSVAGTPVTDLFNWSLEFNAEAVPCPIKGERFNTVAVGGLDVRITAERFVDHAGGAQLANLAVDQFAGSTPPGTEVTYALDQLAGIGGATISGSGVVIRGGLTAPRDLANDTLEIHGTTVPVIT